jgi:rRNA maturation endonuclease Nob1
LVIRNDFDTCRSIKKKLTYLVTIVTEFSKKTGDFGVLSQPDLQVLALTYTLEKRENGDANIRQEPLTVSFFFMVY